MRSDFHPTSYAVIKVWPCGVAASLRKSSLCLLARCGARERPGLLSLCHGAPTSSGCWDCFAQSLVSAPHPQNSSHTEKLFNEVLTWGLSFKSTRKVDLAEWCHVVKVLPNFTSVLLSLFTLLMFFVWFWGHFSWFLQGQLNVLNSRCLVGRMREIWLNSRPELVLFSPTEGESDGVMQLAASSGL